ncbi:Di-/tripeptide transporter [Ruminococcaceae bacterium BL-4]|jgi:POT family proton-dependent oligopeptide transporter|nr:Di-/tripeptide transporter [Ruminococcaceae bacterium BL-4]
MERQSRALTTPDFAHDKRFLGHPKGMFTTSFMALSEAFGNYGMTAILIYYLYTSVSQGGLGFSQNEAAQLLNVYNSLACMAGIIGGFVADRFLGIRRSMLVGYSIKTIGYLLLAIPAGGKTLYLISQLVLLIASMSMGSSLYALAGKLYGKTDTRRDSGFSIMYIMNNVGAIAPMITGALAMLFNYNVGFLFAGILQGVGLVIYILTSNKLFGDVGTKPDDPAPADKKKKLLLQFFITLVVLFGTIIVLFATGAVSVKVFCNVVSTVSIFIPLAYIAIIMTSKKTTRVEAKRLWPFLWLFACNCFNMMVWFQSTSILAIYADQRVNLQLGPWTMTPASFQTVPAVLAVIFGSVVSWLWTKLGSRQPSTTLKFGVGTVFYGASALFMVIPYTLFPANVKVSPLWLIMFYVLNIWGEAMTSPVGFSTATLLAPTAFTAQMVTVWKLGQSTGAGLSSLAVNFYTPGHEAQYFAIIGGVTALLGISLWIFHKKMQKIIETKEEPTDNVQAG